MAVRAESSITVDEGLDEQTLDDRLRPGPLGPVLARHVVELVLERSESNRPVRPLHVRTPAVSVTVTACAVDVGAGPLAMEELFEVAFRAVSAFVDAGAFVLVRPNLGPVFLFPLPASSGEDGEVLDEVTVMCRRLDEEQARARSMPALRDLVVEVRLGEGIIAGAAARVGTLLPAAVWRAV